MLAQARADLVDHAAQLAEAREQLRALQAPQRAEVEVETAAAPALTEDERQELVVLRRARAGPESLGEANSTGRTAAFLVAASLGLIFASPATP